MFKSYQNYFLISLLVSDFQRSVWSVQSIPEAYPCIIKLYKLYSIEEYLKYRKNEIKGTLKLLQHSIKKTSSILASPPIKMCSLFSVIAGYHKILVFLGLKYIDILIILIHCIGIGYSLTQSIYHHWKKSRNAEV